MSRANKNEGAEPSQNKADFCVVLFNNFYINGL